MFLSTACPPIAHRPATPTLLPTLLLLLSWLFVIEPSQAQDVSTYQFAASNGTFTPLTGGTIISSLAVSGDATSVGIGLPFTFYYGGTPYTTVKATSEGYLDFTGFSSAYSNNIFGGNRFVAPLWDELSGVNGTASYAITGTSPNRVFTFQWLNWRWNSSAAEANISFQVKLYEGTNAIQFVYRPEMGPFFSASASATIGLDGSTSYIGDSGNTHNFVSLTDATTTATLVSNQYPSASVNTINTRPVAGQTYTFTPINDYCGHATPLRYGTTVAGSTIEASQRDDPRASCSVGGTRSPSTSPGVFYSLVGNGQTVTVSTCVGASAAGGNTKLFVYSGTCGNFVCVGNNDDILGGCGTNPQASAVTFPTTTGTLYYVFVQYAQQGTAGPFSLSVSGTGLAMASAMGAGSVEVFPNPARQAFTLRLPALAGEKIAHLLLFNSLGQQVQARAVGLHAGGTQAEIDVRALAAGLYTLRVQVGQHTAAQHVVIE